MSKLRKFGEVVPGYGIPVLNEREIRAAAGVIFLMMFISVQFVLFKGDMLLFKYSITIFLIDILIRVLINPGYSPSLIIGRFIVSNQAPEYVGAKQKKFAWILGSILSSIVFIHLVMINAYSPITGIICLICLIFLFFEAAFGICIGCKIYPLFYKERVQYCAGEVCETKSKQNIQKISKSQLVTILLFTLIVILMSILLSDFYKKKPFNLFESNKTIQVK